MIYKWANKRKFPIDESTSGRINIHVSERTVQSEKKVMSSLAQPDNVSDRRTK